MLLFLLSISNASPQSDWLRKQYYPTHALLPKTLNTQQKDDFLKQTHSYLIKKFSQTKFSCQNGSALHFPFSSSSNAELQKTYALETMVCIPSFNWKKAFSLYMSPSFRSNHMTGVASATKSGEEICVTTDSFIGVVKAAKYCLQAIEQPITNGTLLYSYLSKNQRQSGLQPIYFQEEFIYFQQFGADVLIHRLSINRSRELGTAGEYVLRQKSKEYPPSMIESMKSQP